MKLSNEFYEAFATLKLLIDDLRLTAEERQKMLQALLAMKHAFEKD